MRAELGPSSDPSTFRKTVVTIVAGLVTMAAFAFLFGASYLIFPASKGNHATDNSAPTANLTRSDQTTALQVPDSAAQSHAHAAFMVFVKGERIDFSLPQYQSRDSRMQFENGDGFTLHKHDNDAWFGPFFESLNMTLANNCLSIANRTSFCSNFDNQISFIVNGQPSGQFQHYIPYDKDRILISYGKGEEIDAQLQQLDAVTIKP